MENKHRRITTAILGFFLIAASSSPVFGQFENAGDILRAGTEDANILLKEYLRPLGEGFGTDLNSGWFSTAKTHKFLGFDLTVNASVAFIPDSDQLFDLSALNLQEVELVSNGPTSPTIAGDEVPGAVIGSIERNPVNGERLFEFQLPEGSGFPYIPAPMVQASVGLIKNTDLTVRYLPEISLPNDIDLDLFGIGIKHEITNWFPGGKALPVDISLQAGYTNISASIDFEVLPRVDTDTKNEFDASVWEGQQGSIDTDAFTANLLVGKTLPVLSVFGGVGYQTSTVDLTTPGSFPVTVPNEDFDPALPPSNPDSNPKRIARVENPIDISYDDNGSFHGVAGFRIRLLILNISGSFTLSKTPVGQVGVGIGIR